MFQGIRQEERSAHPRFGGLNLIEIEPAAAAVQGYVLMQRLNLHPFIARKLCSVCNVKD